MYSYGVVSRVLQCGSVFLLVLSAIKMWDEHKIVNSPGTDIRYIGTESGF